MSYAQFGTIQASDYNTLVGGNPTTTSNTLNAVWATGGAGAGYGQTALANVSAGQSVAASEWANLVNSTSTAATHQGSSITAVTAPSSGGTVTYLSAIPTNLTTIYTNKYNAASQGTTSANGSARATTWTTSLTFTYTATFANGDAARYFFNAGGQIKFTFSQPTGTALANAYATLATACGTLVLSAQNSGTTTIASTSYTGFTKVGGSGSPTVNSTNTGYLALTTANTTLFTQQTGSPTNYTTSSISLLAKTNGTQGSNSDNGNVLTFYSVWQEAPSTGATVTAGANVSMTVVYPETTNISNTWGAVTTSTSVTGT
jgi:hypothetical protein